MKQILVADMAQKNGEAWINKWTGNYSWELNAEGVIPENSWMKQILVANMACMGDK